MITPRPTISDQAILARLAPRLERRRLDRNLTQAQLAHEAGVSKRTIERIESGQSIQLSNFIRILRVLDLLDRLDLLIPPSVPSPIEQLRLQRSKRRRATTNKPPASDEPWRWGDS